MLPAMTEDDLRRDFTRIDTDGNGAIDRTEFAQLIASLGLDMSEDRMYVAFQAIDIDGNGAIEFGEFAAWWKRR